MADAIIPFRNLTGGTDDSYLDYWDGDGLSDGQMAFGIVDGQQLAYVLDTSSGATENNPYVISPDTNAGTKRWILASQMWFDRGDISSNDYTQASLTMDNNWNDLDLSSIVPTGTTFVRLKGSFYHSSVPAFILFRKNGWSNENGRTSIFAQVASTSLGFDTVVPCDTNGVIEYRISASLTNIVFSVVGWQVN